MARSDLPLWRGVLAAALLLLVASAGAEFQTRDEALAALDKYNRLIEAQPDWAVLHTLRGDAYYALDDLYAAMQNYTAAIKLDARQDRAYFGRGMALGRLGLVDEGIADLDVYIARHPASSVAYTKRGVRNIWRNRLDAAERDLKRAIALDPANAEAHDDLGVVHAKHQRLALAAEHFRTAIRLDPGYQKAYHNLAICFHLVGQHAEALQIIEAGLRLDANSRSSQLLKAGILDALGRKDEAKEIAELAEFLPDDNWSERSSLGALEKEEAK
ncbi:MAG: tetratricopeptide repeat protein [Gammaproteobacteria bacterium]